MGNRYSPVVSGLGRASYWIAVHVGIKVTKLLAREQLFHNYFKDLECAYVIILMRAKTHGGWAHGQRVSTTF